jgi:hypothetical protein
MRGDHSGCLFQSRGIDGKGDERALIADAEHVEDGAQVPEDSGVTERLSATDDGLLVEAEAVSDESEGTFDELNRTLERVEQLAVSEIQLCAHMHASEVMVVLITYE